MQREICFIINKSEITAGTRGASLGPEAIMAEARKNETQLFGLNEVRWIKDENYRLDLPIKYHHAKKIEGLLTVFRSISAELGEVIEEKKFPVVLAGDHGSAGGTIAGLKAAYPAKRLGVIWIDAHGDIHTPYTTPSGNMHGMPLSTALGLDNLECKRNDISAEVIGLWEELKNVGITGAKLLPEDLIFIGVRDTEEEEDYIIQRLGIKNFTVEELRRLGAEAVATACLDRLHACDMIYVSFDVDSMDPEETSRGTGTPVANGLSVSEARTLLNRFAQEDKLVALEVVEVNPCLDEKTNKMAATAFSLIEELAEKLKK